MQDLALNASDGRVFVWTGRGSWADIAKTSLTEMLDDFDCFVAWVRDGSRRIDIDISAEARQRVIEAYHYGERLLATGAVASPDMVPLYRGAE